MQNNIIPDEKEIGQALASIATVDKTLTMDELQIRLRQLKSIRKKVEARKEEITAPMREALASARALFKPLETKLEEADKVLRKEILVLEERREKEQAKLAGKVASGKMSVDKGMDLMVPQNDGLFRMVKKLKIVAKAKIPDKYWVIDEVALRKDLMDGKKVPGAELIEEKTVVAR